MIRNSFVIFLLFLSACTNSVEEIDSIFEIGNTTIDIGKNVTISYSDSSVTQVIIEAPTIEKHNSVQEPKDIFPDGIKVTFLNPDGSYGSWLEADKAIRWPKEKKVIAIGNVNFYNRKEDKLSSHELIWQETDGKIYTEKFVRITRPSRGDTLYGVGFVTDQDFKVVTLKRRTQGQMEKPADF